MSSKEDAKQFGFQKGYEILKGLESGEFSKVFLLQHQISGRKYVGKVKSKTLQGIIEKEQLSNEIWTVAQIKHENIVKFHQISSKPDSFVYIMEYMEGGTLLDHAIRGRFSNHEYEARMAVEQIISAVSYLHKKQVAHCNLQLNSFMFGSDEKTLKLVELSHCVSAGSRGSIKTGYSPTKFTAPEACESLREYNGYQADVWSIGVILYFLATTNFPFNEVSTIEDFRDCNYIQPRNFSTELSQLLEQIFVFSPAERATLKSVQQSEWLTFTQQSPSSKDDDDYYTACDSPGKTVRFAACPIKENKSVPQNVGRKGASFWQLMNCTANNETAYFHHQQQEPNQCELDTVEVNCTFAFLINETFDALLKKARTVIVRNGFEVDCSENNCFNCSGNVEEEKVKWTVSITQMSNNSTCNKVQTNEGNYKIVFECLSVEHVNIFNKIVSNFIRELLQDVRH